MSEDKNSKKSHYISGAESRRIAKENAKATKYYEKRKKRKVKEEEFITQMQDASNILEIEDLQTYFFTDAGVVKAVNGVTFSIPEGSTVGVVGESGCGKSVTSLSTMQLVQGPAGQIVGGSIRFKSNSYKRDAKGQKIPVLRPLRKKTAKKNLLWTSAVSLLLRKTSLAAIYMNARKGLWISQRCPSKQCALSGAVKLQ